MEAGFYSKNPKFYVAVDCIIFGFAEGRLKVLLQNRNFEPFSGEKSLQGGFVQDDENVDAAALRILKERTGINNVYINQVGAFGDVNRDPGARVISVAFTCLIDRALCNEETVKEYHGEWVNIDELPELHFGHSEMVAAALLKLQMQIGKQPVGFYLLPTLFTLTQLQHLHEAILGETIDKRNFRKRVAEMPFIEKTDQVDRIHSKRGAALYRYNKALFEKINKFKL